ncbi:hypothetical protein SISNIDRAFT_491951 [Sistotremastrum niveocremeum HHB9708]|uniref:Uncharacterized protein n=1 Tax=Sistotremastrum niveocremeum HHB9708 TaxID=1314777 RepID=A0A164M7K7_9AGAM|nr:hypothetical protein SISNIDRAFT_491951 [Sistotremastrum niveocremeum HHB9708]
MATQHPHPPHHAPVAEMLFRYHVLVIRERFQVIVRPRERLDIWMTAHGYPLVPYFSQFETPRESINAIREFVFQYNQRVDIRHRLPLPRRRSRLRWYSTVPMTYQFFQLYRRFQVYAYAAERDSSDDESDDSNSEADAEEVQDLVVD